MKEFVKSITSPYEKELIETRRYLHRHPELSFQETDTAAYIRSTLNALGVPLMEGISGTSTVAVIKGEKTGPCIAFRADIDALPVEEKMISRLSPRFPALCMPVDTMPILQCFLEQQRFWRHIKTR